MNYAEIISGNANIAPVSWWTKFAFHFTDVTNAVSILSVGKLFSRMKATAEHIMVNDNASMQVIDMTMSGALSYVRFYFRPLTPTQYYNEGFKHPQIRYDGGSNANVPVPVFFAFNLEKLLLDKKTKFSTVGQAGHGAPMNSGVEEFAKLDFTKIYANGPLVELDDKNYRHAELLYPGEFPIKDAIEAILCRNEVERNTLLNLLYETDKTAFFYYKNKIRICKSDMFEKNGLYIDNILLNDSKLSIVFADSQNKRYYERKQMEQRELNDLTPIKFSIVLEWRGSNNLVKNIESPSIEIDYQTIGHLILDGIPKINGAKTLAIKILLEDKLMAYSIHSLNMAEII